MHLTYAQAYYTPNIMQNYALSIAYANFVRNIYKHSLKLGISTLQVAVPPCPRHGRNGAVLSCGRTGAHRMESSGRGRGGAYPIILLYPMYDLRVCTVFIPYSEKESRFVFYHFFYNK